MGVEKEWDMVPDAEIAVATVDAAQNCLSPEPVEEMVLDTSGGGGSSSNNAGADRRGKKSRGKFEQTKLNETNLTRRMKACVRCRIQRVRVCMSNTWRWMLLKLFADLVPFISWDECRRVVSCYGLRCSHHLFCTLTNLLSRGF